LSGISFILQQLKDEKMKKNTTDKPFRKPQFIQDLFRLETTNKYEIKKWCMHRHIYHQKYIDTGRLDKLCRDVYLHAKSSSPNLLCGKIINQIMKKHGFLTPPDLTDGDKYCGNVNSCHKSSDLMNPYNLEQFLIGLATHVVLYKAIYETIFIKIKNKSIFPPHNHELGTFSRSTLQFIKTIQEKKQNWQKPIKTFDFTKYGKTYKIYLKNLYLLKKIQQTRSIQLIYIYDDFWPNNNPNIKMNEVFPKFYIPNPPPFKKYVEYVKNTKKREEQIRNQPPRNIYLYSAGKQSYHTDKYSFFCSLKFKSERTEALEFIYDFLNTKISDHHLVLSIVQNYF